MPLSFGASARGATGGKIGQFTIQWHGEKMTRDVMNTMTRRIGKAATEYETALKKALSTSNRKDGPSLPGQIPHADRGHLRRSVQQGSIDRLHRWIGYTSKLGLLFELGGTSHYEIKPVNAGALTIPIRDEDIVETKTTAQGRRRRKYVKTRFSERWWRMFSRRGQKYILMDRVRRPPMKKRPALMPVLEQVAPKLMEILAAPL